MILTGVPKLLFILMTTSSRIFAGNLSIFALPPQDSESRETKSLDGVWSFRVSPSQDPYAGFRERWFEEPLEDTGDFIDMPVPSSYNDITQSSALRDYVGWVWYSRKFFISPSWKSERVFIRFGSVHYTAVVYLNRNKIVSHSGGHLPFAAEVTNYVKFGEENLITVAVDNTLSDLTIPQGRIVRKQNSSEIFYPANYTVLDYNFDFFNYAGIHRPVIIYSVPTVFVKDVKVTTNIQESGVAKVEYKVIVDSGNVSVKLLDPSGTVVNNANSADGQFLVTSPQLWWPYLMHSSPGKQYTLVVQVNSPSTVDIYRQKFGIRHITWTKKGVYINGKKLYIRGFGKHEDSDIRGKGLDFPLIVKDFNLIEWVGANCFRTSHYPYAEEIMDMADSRGIMVIDETPAVALDFNSASSHSALLDRHINVLKELLSRDKNRPSVIMWSLSNEAHTYQPIAKSYYEHLVATVHQIDPTRPITAVLNTDPATDKVANILDVICVNHYFSWYEDSGHLELIELQSTHYFSYWHTKFGLPLINSEYGADTIAGMHREPSFLFTEEYQVHLMADNFRTFETLRKEEWFMGEMIWNFADFMTKQQITRVGGNKKGIFTRQRQPKMSAHLLRSRYWKLARVIDSYPDLPPDLMFSSSFTAISNQQNLIDLSRNIYIMAYNSSVPRN